MQSNKSKSLPILMAIFLLMLQGCSSFRATSQTEGQDAKEQSASAEEINKEAKEKIGRENAPRVSELILGPGDQLEIMVYRNDNLTREVRIDPSGKIMYPLTGDIHAADLSVFQLRDEIRDGLSKYIIDPQITIRIISIQSQKIIVLGEVQKPGFFQAETSPTALEAISQAGGFTDDAKRKSALLIRGGMENPELRVLNLEKALEAGDLTQNIVLKGGDIIYIPRTTISDVSRFFAYLSDIISPIVSSEAAYLLGREIVSGEKTQKSIPLR
ncbi:MAG: polysaccharide biosynthesis/export family protein [Desulfatiglandales bacterium]